MAGSVTESGRLLAEQRRRQILALLESRGAISAEELADSFNVSHMTVWRDLTVLEESGKLRRVRGGAVRQESTPVAEPFYNAKRIVNRTKKDAIASYAARTFVHDNDIIILEAGTTVTALIKHLNCSSLTLITNGLGIINEAIPSIPDITVMSCGGILRDVSRTFVGPQALDFFRNVRADTFFVSATGLTFPEGITDPNPLEIQVKQAMAQSAARVIALIDSSKFGQRSLATIMPLTAITAIVTDSDAPAEDLKRLEALGTQVHIAGGGDARSPH